MSFCKEDEINFEALAFISGDLGTLSELLCWEPEHVFQSSSTKPDSPESDQVEEESPFKNILKQEGLPVVWFLFYSAVSEEVCDNMPQSCS